MFDPSPLVRETKLTTTVCILFSIYESFIKLEGNILMKNMPDELLIEAYFKAIKINLEPDFIYLLEAEIRRRSLSHKIKISS